jgi:hypothetical protein
MTLADLFLDFEAGTAGNVTTAANLDTASHGAVSTSWTVGDGSGGTGPLTRVFVNNLNQARRNSFLVDGVTYTGVGTRSMKFVHDASPYEFLHLPAPAVFNDLTISGLTYFDGVGVTTFDHINIAGASYVVLQNPVGGAGGTAGEVHAEGQVSGVTYKSVPIPIDIGWYEWHLRFKGSDGTVALVVLNATTGALVGTSGVNGSDAAGPVNYIRIQDYIDSDEGGETIHDSFVFGWGANAMLPLDEDFVSPPPTAINLTQTAVDEVRLIWYGHGLSYLIERRTNGGAWSTLETYAPTGAGSLQREYLDSTVSDSTLYEYRISAIIGDFTSAPTSMGGITTDNSPGGTETTYITQALAGSSVSIAEGHTLTQRLRNTLGTTLYISEIALDSEFWSRENLEYLYLCENEDGSGEIYGVSNALSIAADGPLVFEFFTSAPVPTTGCYFRYAPVFARTQIKYRNADVYETGLGYNGNYDSTGNILGTTSDLNMTVKQRAPFVPSQPGNPSTSAMAGMM